MNQQQSNEFKTLGNEAFSSGDYDKAIEHFSKAIELDPQNHVLYSNRSAAFCSLKKYDEALEDAECSIKLKPDWSKSYGRKGAALAGKGLTQECIAAYKSGLAIEPNNVQLQKGLESVNSQASDSGLGKMFQKILTDPRFSHIVRQPDFLQKLLAVQSNPNGLQDLMGDPRFMEVMQAMMADSKDQPNPNHSHGDDGCGCGHEHEQEEPQAKQNKPKEDPKSSGSTKSEISTVRLESDKEKDIANKLYASKDFENALQHYKTAFEIDPTNIAVLNNQAAVLFEQGKFDECIKKCEEAIESGREIRADFKIIAKAFSRIGSAYAKQEKYEEAIKYFNKSLTESRDPQVLSKLKEAEKAKILKEKASNYNPQLAEQERNFGNEFYKAGKFADAIRHYTLAIKHDEKDPRAYSNRAACYQKLNAIPEAQKDCESCIQLDPKFVKAYIRKATIHLLKKEFDQCIRTCDQAFEADSQQKHYSEIEELKQKCQIAMPQSDRDEVAKKAMNDPEIQQIMNDPVMRSILEQMQQDPKAFAEHMKSPLVATKIRKLINAGIIRTA